LIVVSGISSEGKNILLAVAVMQKETTENYVWLL